MRHIIDEFQHVALAHPEIFFSLHHNGNRLFHLPQAKLRQRIVGVMGNKINEKLIPIQEETDVIRINGYIGKPEAAKKTRGEQFFFVNNRFIKSSYLNHAILSAYDELLTAKTYPLYVVFLEIDPAKIDVNVHPTKQEIKFVDESLVYNYLRVTARHALAQNSITPSLDFDIESSISQHLDAVDLQRNTPPTYIPKFDETTSGTKDKGYSGNPFSQPPSSKREESNTQNWEKLYENLSFNDEETTDEEHIFSSIESEDSGIILTSKASAEQPEEDQILKSKGATAHAPQQLYQLHQKFIVSPIKSGFLLIEQQTAHFRIMYERYLMQLKSKQASTQKLLFPLTIELPMADAMILSDLLVVLNDLGMDIQEFGSNTFVIHGLPVELSNVNEKQMLEGLLENFKFNLDYNLELYENLARALALQACIKNGKKLQAEEMQQLIDELFACEVPYIAPTGRKTFISVQLDELSKRFD